MSCDLGKDDGTGLQNSDLRLEAAAAVWLGMQRFKHQQTIIPTLDTYLTSMNLSPDFIVIRSYLPQCIITCTNIRRSVIWLDFMCASLGSHSFSSPTLPSSLTFLQFLLYLLTPMVYFLPMVYLSLFFLHSYLIYQMYEFGA